jgi:uncharacterized protein
MLPFLFGAPGRELFGSLHSRPPATPARHAVLLCTSFGREALQLHRTLRLIADRLSRSGIDVLRLDYFGTGDAGGADEDADLAGWARDIGVAHGELVRRAGVQRITWMGFRLGAAAIQLAAANKPAELSRLVLVDPLADGRRFLDTLRTMRNEHEQKWDEPESHAFRNGEDVYLDEALGFAIPRVYCDQLRALRFTAPSTDSVVIADASLEDGRDVAAACSGNPRVRFVNHAFGPQWFGRIVPPHSIKLLVDEASSQP